MHYLVLCMCVYVCLYCRTHTIEAVFTPEQFGVLPSRATVVPYPTLPYPAIIPILIPILM